MSRKIESEQPDWFSLGLAVEKHKSMKLPPTLSKLLQPPYEKSNGSWKSLIISPQPETVLTCRKDAWIPKIGQTSRLTQNSAIFRPTFSENVQKVAKAFDQFAWRFATKHIVLIVKGNWARAVNSSIVFEAKLALQIGYISFTVQ